MTNDDTGETYLDLVERVRNGRTLYAVFGNYDAVQGPLFTEVGPLQAVWTFTNRAAAKRAHRMYPFPGHRVRKLTPERLALMLHDTIMEVGIDNTAVIFDSGEGGSEFLALVDSPKAKKALNGFAPNALRLGLDFTGGGILNAALGDWGFGKTRTGEA